MSLDIALAQKAGEMSSADVRLVRRERIDQKAATQAEDRRTDKRTHFEIFIKMADENKVRVLPVFDTLCQFTRTRHAVVFGQFERRPCKPVARPRWLLRPVVARACILCVCIWCFAYRCDAMEQLQC